MKYFIILLSLSLMGLALPNDKQIDSSSSLVRFEISNMKFRTVTGNFSGMKGEMKFNPDALDQSSFDVCIDASSVNTGNTKRDDHLRNADFFEVETYPLICFKSESVSKKGDNYSTNGILTIHGVSKPVIIPFSVEKNIFLGTLNINRFDYDIGKETGTFMVGEEVSLLIKCAVE